MEYVSSFNATKAGKAYIAKVRNLHPDGDIMLFHVDSGSGVTLLGLDTLCSPSNISEYASLKKIIEDEIQAGDFDKIKSSASTVTKEEIEMFPCKFEGVSVSGTKPITLYFYIYLGDIGMPLLGFDYIDDCSYQHSIKGNLIFTAVADEPGKRFYPEKVMDFNKILNKYKSQR